MKYYSKMVSKDKYAIKCPYPMKPEYITIHETDNLHGASALNEISYMIRNDNQISYHIAVDHNEAVQGIPLNRNAWHCGDGLKGTGNRKSIGIEICGNVLSSDIYNKAVDNTVEIVVKTMKEYNIPITNIVQHNHWSGKNCPSRMRREGKWNDFINKVKSKLNEEKHCPTCTCHKK